ncbi:hypothetical protein [Actinomycetospora termitidis]|uniref:DUF2206 domain-containing protein n=1 Tax=Actinomycetospora termitidis TaxID=3053470 RepID=A0ABT7MFX0_9PSEU|nr:hypothetical protein [Actinomycetospora sp. Odt1-22]MDL5159559.1 hypothetical protein [Actinomycetospora sp. Odt1-22]
MTTFVDLVPRPNAHHRDEGPPRPGDLLSARPDVVLAAAGLAALAALVPVRGVWAAQVVLVVLVLTLPGVLLVRALRLPTALTVPLTVPASLLVLLISGLGLNAVGPYVGVAQPLRTGPVLVALELVCLVLLVVVATRRRFESADVVHPFSRHSWARLLGRWDLLAPAVVPLVALLGALRLNAADSTGPATSGAVAAGTVVTGSLAVAGAVLVLVALVGGLVVAGRADDVFLGATLYAAGLAVLWSFSLRAESIYGYDVMTEFRKMLETIDAGWWDSFRPGDAYGAMLSVTVLPAQLHALSGVSAEILVKVVFPAVFATTPVIVYALCRRFLRPRWAFLGAALLVVQPNFGQQMPGLAKQEIGFVLFAALLLVLVWRFRSRVPQAVMVVALALGVVVTHYSSTYFGIVILGGGFVVTVLASAVLRRWQQVTMVGLATLTLVLGAGLWNSTVTHSSSNLSDAALGFEVSGFDLLPNRALGDDLLTGYIKGNTTPQVSAPEYQRLVTDLYAADRRYILPVPDAGSYPIADVGPAPPVSIPQLLVGFGLQQVAYLMAAVAGLVLTLRRRSSPTERLVGAMILGSVAALAMLRLSGTLAQAYNQDRALLQALMVLVVGVGWSAQALARHRLKVVTAGAVVMIGALFALNSSLLPAISGGGRINLAGGGEDFQRFYTYRAEVTAARWLGDQPSSRRQVVYADRYGTLRFLLGTGRQVGVFPEIVPSVIDKSAWIYGTSANIREGEVRSQTSGQMATYRFPREFLDAHYDVVYTNGTSTVWHR